MREINPHFAVIITIIFGVFATWEVLFSMSVVYFCNDPVFANAYIDSSDNFLHDTYVDDEDFFETAFNFQSREVDVFSNVTAGIIPHHLLAADMIAEFFKNLEDDDYDTIILIGPNHENDGDSKMITSVYDWNTSYGILDCDRGISDALISMEVIFVDEDAIFDEHSITSEVAFIKRTFPDSRIVPVILKSSTSSEEAEDLAQAIYSAGKKQSKKILVLASVDFSHYKNSAQAQADDTESIEAISDYNFDSVYDLAVDSPASIYTVMELGSLSDAEFILLNNSNSALLSGDLELESTTSYVTGYFVGG